MSAVLFSSGWVTAQEPTPSSPLIHIVQTGENIFQIARMYNVPAEVLAQANGIINPTNMRVGQQLIIPVDGGTAPMILPTVTPSFSVTEHVIQAGESLQIIADLYGVTVAEIIQWNSLANPDFIYAGQTLRIQIPFFPPTATPPPPPQVITPSVTRSASLMGDIQPITVSHTIMSGDTLSRIATLYGVKMEDIVAANGITNPTLIFAGQVITVPNVIAPQYSAELPPLVQSLDVLPVVLIEGQTARFRVTTATPLQLTGTFLDRDINFMTDETGLIYTAFVGVPVGTSADLYTLKLDVALADGAQASADINLNIVSGNYALETIQLLEDRTGLLEASVEDAEMQILRQVMSRFTPERYFIGMFRLPSQADVSSTFGNTRSYNGGEFSRIHSGTDFGAVPGTPIMAPAAGQVVLADTLNVRGVATVLDHGWGIYSGYWHQTERNVQLGDMVQLGQVIGTVGNTGRVSGPHLHWEIWVNGVPVDPMQWIVTDFFAP